MSKVWFITGAGSGLGTGIAKAALRAGDRVVATGRNLEKVRNVYRRGIALTGARAESDRIKPDV